ncbi:Scd6-like Sm domain-containing protein [Aspergillus egyptiacus]|nr:Scd6-like Sm domain-containing protein [Aspergillus egyptiacus]
MLRNPATWRSAELLSKLLRPPVVHSPFRTTNSSPTPLHLSLLPISIFTSFVLLFVRPPSHTYFLPPFHFLFLSRVVRAILPVKMDMNHLIGQRFNLISKSDIRYVGTLHEINPEASTIALQNVVSFGTEGRRGNPAEEIPPSNSIYEYIVFRGSDVKDISVADDTKENAQPEPPRMPDDPAILGSTPQPGPGPQVFPQQPQQPPQQPLQQPPQGPRPPPPGYPQQPQFQGYYPPYGPRYPPFPPGPGYPAMPYGAPPGWYPPGQGFPQPPGQFPPQMPIGPPGPHRTPPTQGAAPTGPKATSELPVSDRPVSKPPGQEPTAAPAPARPVDSAPTPPIESKPSVAEAVKATTSPTERAPPTGPRAGRAPPVIPITTPAKPSVPVAASAPLAPANANNVTQGTAQAAITEATRAATAAVAAAMAKLPQPNGQKKPQPGDVSVEGITRQMGEMKPYEASRAPRGGQQTRGRGGHRGQHHAQANKKVEVPKTDYDFETANAKFNKQDLVKEAIATGSPVEEVESPAQTTNVAELAPTTQSASVYNKSTSFFDNISSEARDREEGTGARSVGREWRGEEEKRNIETFGQGSVDGYRSSYRGRGRGRGYGRGRGGYGRGYGSRGRGGRPQSTGVPTAN